MRKPRWSLKGEQLREFRLRKHFDRLVVLGSKEMIDFFSPFLYGELYRERDSEEA